MALYQCSGIAMDSNGDPFSRRKRMNKSMKRKKRPERLSFTAESESDTDEVHPPRKGKPVPLPSLANMQSTRLKPHNRPFGVPQQSAVYGDESKKAHRDNDEKPDYSSQGLQLLREQTASRPKIQPGAAVFASITEGDEVTMCDAKPHSVLSAQEKTKVNSDDALAAVRNAEFISLDRDATEMKIGSAFDVETIAACDPMVLDNVAGNSDEDEWEREQLKRAGLALQDERNVTAVDSGKAREIIEEEDMRLGARGETGPSLIETCLECITEELSQTNYRVSQLTSQIDAIQKSIGNSVSVLAQHEAAIVKLKARESDLQKFYHGTHTM